MQFIETDAALATLARSLSDAQVLFLDTEFDSSRAGKKLSLIQVSDGARIYVVDTLRLERLDPLARAMTRPDVTWVLHAGKEDLELLSERFSGGRPTHLFDTQLAWALLGPEAAVSLAYLQFKLLGIRSMKTHQTDDWLRRPLPASQLAYAASDIEHLPEVHRALRERLVAIGRENVVLEATVEQLARDEIAPPPPLSLKSFRNAWQLDARAQAALLHLIDWYNALDDEERRSAPQPKTLLSIASRMPLSTDDLGRIKGVSSRFLKRHGNRVVQGLRGIARASQDPGFVPIEPLAYSTYDEIRLDGWLSYMRAEVSAAASVAPELAFNSRAMASIREAIVSAKDRRAGERALVGWRRTVLREPYLAFAERT